MITCTMVTQPSRLALAALAIGDYARQTHAERELLVLHDGDAACGAALAALAARHPEAAIRIVAAAPGQTLGALRNRAIAAARGDWICQWDDDDRYHPQRLALQWRELVAREADFCFLVDQLHWFPHAGEMYWDDWNAEAYPLNFVQGTLLGRRDLLPPCPDVARGEDTGAVREIVRRQHRIARLRGAGWCYVYVYHGANVWPQAHHRAIVAAKRYGAAGLLQQARALRARLPEYAPAFGRVTLPHDAGALVVET